MLLEGVIKKDNRFLNENMFAYENSDESKGSQEPEEYDRVLKIRKYLKTEMQSVLEKDIADKVEQK